MNAADREAMPMEQIERAVELWYASIDAGYENDFWRLPSWEIRYWLDRAEQEPA